MTSSSLNQASTSASATTSSSSSNCFSTTSEQAWSILKRHARDDIIHLRLQELCRDNDRVSSLVSVYNSNNNSNDNDNDSNDDDNNNNNNNRILMVDISRQKMTLETINHLLRLANAGKVKQFITQLAWGTNDPNNPVLPSRIKMKQKKEQHNSSKRQQQAQEEVDDDGVGRNNNNKQQQRRRHYHHHIVYEPFCYIPSYHLALRVPSQQQGLEMLDSNGTNILIEIHNDWERMKRISVNLRRGTLPGITGKMISDIVVVGRGTSIMALRFVYLALCKDKIATIGRRVGMGGRGPVQRRIKFLTSVDPIRAAAVVADSDPATTLVITVALTGETETIMSSQLLQTWLLTNLGGHGRRTENILSKHMILITGNETLAAKYKPESVFILPNHSRCEPFTTFTAANLLPLSIVFGWPIVDAFLAGAHDMDSHFVETNPRHNLPVLLALTDIWNDCLSSTNNQKNVNIGRIVTPFTEAFAAYPAFVAAIESQTCGGKKQPSDGSSATQTCTSVVIDGGLHGIYDRSVYQSSDTVTSELVMTLDSQLSINADLTSSSHQHHEAANVMENVYEAQDTLICSLFAYADTLALGSFEQIQTSQPQLGDSPLGNTGHSPLNGTRDESEVCSGNRPCTLLLCGKLDAFTCGQLVAMAEHRAIIKAWICDIDPFAKELGTSFRSKRSESLKYKLARMMVQNDREEDEEEENVQDGGSSNLNLSTKTILRHYANMYKDQRVYTAKG